ncbi:hypothetical protein SSX86_033150, partial [Deinandra increscens subsp. villosa]
MITVRVGEEEEEEEGRSFDRRSAAGDVGSKQSEMKDASLAITDRRELRAYALDVNVERAEDVITHKRVLKMAEDPANRPAFEVRLVQVGLLQFATVFCALVGVFAI